MAITSVSEKRCSKCGELKPTSEFNRNTAGRSKTGLTSRCKECGKKASAKWKAENRERYDALQKDWRNTDHAKELNRHATRNWNAKNTHKKAAHDKVQKALKRGTLVRQPCEVCGKEPAEAHHDDYDKPLDVRWLCKQHHEDHHNAEE